MQPTATPSGHTADIPVIAAAKEKNSPRSHCFFGSQDFDNGSLIACPAASG